MKLNLVIITCLLFSSVSVFSKSCFPKNNQKFPISKDKFLMFKSVETEGINEIEFKNTIESFLNFWTPVIQSKYGKKLVIKGLWSNETVDAHATRDDDNNPVIVINGGLARHPKMTASGLALILCHELGHHFGGAPKSFRGNSERRSWSSAEGQADYFAASKCIPKMLEGTFLFNNQIDFAAENCNDKYCRSVLPGAMSVGKVFASMRVDWKDPSIQKKAAYQLSMTNFSHPEPQCRLDTFIAGSLCAGENDGDFDNSDYKQGACIKENYPEAARPGCWFAPKSH